MFKPIAKSIIFTRATVSPVDLVGLVVLLAAVFPNLLIKPAILTPLLRRFVSRNFLGS